MRMVYASCLLATVGCTRPDLYTLPHQDGCTWVLQETLGDDEVFEGVTPRDVADALDGVSGTWALELDGVWSDVSTFEMRATSLGTAGTWLPIDDLTGELCNSDNGESLKVPVTASLASADGGWVFEGELLLSHDPDFDWISIDDTGWRGPLQALPGAGSDAALDVVGLADEPCADAIALRLFGSGVLLAGVWDAGYTAILESTCADGSTGFRHDGVWDQAD